MSGNKLTRLHVHADGLIVSKSDTDNQPVKLTLASAETEVTGGEVVGQIDFKSADDGASGDGIVCASIQAEALSAFNGTADPTKLSFLTRNSGASAERMVITPQGVGIRTTNVDASVDLAIGESNTGLVLPSAGELAVRTGGNERMRVTNNGVGIRTTTVANNVDLAIGDSDTGLKQQSDGELALVQNGNERMRVTNNGVAINTFGVHESVDLAIGDTDTGFKTGTVVDQQHLAVITNTVERMRFTNDGLKIGAAVPSSHMKLQIKSDPEVAVGTDNFASQNNFGQFHIETHTQRVDGGGTVAGTSKLKIGIEQSSANVTPKAYLQCVIDNISKGQLLLNPAGGVEGGVGIKTTSVADSVDLAIGDSDTGFKAHDETTDGVTNTFLAVNTNGQERMRVTNNAVGIGVTDPEGKLHIYESTGTSIQPGELIANRSGTIILEHGNEGGESSILFKSKVNEGSDYGFIRYIDDGATNGASNENSLLEIGVQNDPDATNSDELKLSVPGGFMYMRSNGNVGIGTSAPEQKLDVNGNIHIRGESGATAFSLLNDNNGLLRFRQNGGVFSQGVTQTVHDVMVIAKAGRVGIGVESANSFDSKDRFKIEGGRLSIAYGGTDANGNGDTVFFSGGTNVVNQIGRFRLNWNRSSNFSDYNVQVIMYNNQTNSEEVIGFFENSQVNNNRFTFTGQHRSLMNKNDFTSESTGLIVSSNGKYINMDNSLNPSIDETLPYCILSDIDNDKRVYGVISNKEDTNDQRSAGGGFVSTVTKTNTNEERIFINSLGEGAIWVSNKNGSLENGDYITSTTIKGYGGKQTAEPNTLMNYTVGKITCDCDFSLTKIVKQKLKIITITETLKRKVEEDVTQTTEKSEINYDEIEEKYVQTTVTKEETTKQIVKDTYDLYDTEGNIVGTHEVEREESYNVTKIQIDYDENGDVQYEDDLDENGNQQLVYKYETRFLKADGTQLVDEADYTTRLGNGESVFIACFVGCTYHCG